MSAPQAKPILELHDMGVATRHAAERALTLMANGASKSAALAAEGISARTLGRFIEAKAVALTRAQTDEDAAVALGQPQPAPLSLFPTVTEEQFRQLERRVRMLEIRINDAGGHLANPFNADDPRLR